LERNARITPEKLEKYAKICKKHGITHMEISEKGVIFDINGVNTLNNPPVYGKISKEAQEELHSLQKEQEMDEMKFMDPASYEEALMRENNNG
jgi:hypothetical protein